MRRDVLLAMALAHLGLASEAFEAPGHVRAARRAPGAAAAAAPAVDVQPESARLPAPPGCLDMSPSRGSRGSAAEPFKGAPCLHSKGRCMCCLARVAGEQAESMKGRAPRPAALVLSMQAEERAWQPHSKVCAPSAGIFTARNGPGRPGGGRVRAAGGGGRAAGGRGRAGRRARAGGRNRRRARGPAAGRHAGAPAGAPRPRRRPGRAAGRRARAAAARGCGAAPPTRAPRRHSPAARSGHAAHPAQRSDCCADYWQDADWFHVRRAAWTALSPALSLRGPAVRQSKHRGAQASPGRPPRSCRWARRTRARGARRWRCCARCWRAGRPAPTAPAAAARARRTVPSCARRSDGWRRPRSCSWWTGSRPRATAGPRRPGARGDRGCTGLALTCCPARRNKACFFKMLKPSKLSEVQLV